MSTSWRGRPAPAAALPRRACRRTSPTSPSQVRLIEKSDAKLSGRSATIPVTVQNNLVQGVDHLVLRLTSTAAHPPQDRRRPLRRAADHGRGRAQPVGEVHHHRQRQRPGGGGRPAVHGGRPAVRRPDVTFDVKVTEITPTVMLVIAGGVLLLVLAGFRMYTQRKRAAARQAEEDIARTSPDETRTHGTRGLPGASAASPARSPGQTTRSTRVTRHRTPHRKAPTRPARVREWTVERCRGRWARGR